MIVVVVGKLRCETGKENIYEPVEYTLNAVFSRVMACFDRRSRVLSTVLHRVRIAIVFLFQVRSTIDKMMEGVTLSYYEEDILRSHRESKRH